MDYNKEMTQAIAELEQSIGIKEGFFNNLLQEDDWSFIIKLHALYEAAISDLITERIGQSELKDFIDNLELGGPKGKMRMAQNLGLLSGKEIAFIQKLSEIRNKFVHHIKNTSVNLESYLAKESDKYFKILIYTDKEMIKIGDHTVKSTVFAKENPKITIWMSSFHVLATISCLTATEQKKQDISRSIKAIYDLQKNFDERSRKYQSLITWQG